MRTYRRGTMFQYNGRRIAVQYYSQLHRAYGCVDADDPLNGWYDYFTADQLAGLPRIPRKRQRKGD